ncbi:hypothetical protein AB4439_26670, partial [Vibrio sp. 10N.261.46.C10]
FNAAPELQRELKLITFGWLFNKSPKKKKALTFSGTQSHLTNIKRAYRFLMQESKTSLTALSSSSLWSRFENNLQEKNYAQGSLEHLFVAINGAIH